MRKGFTMIELIFVIVILGILAAVAIPRLAATRDDAEISKAATNVATAVAELTSYYTAQGEWNSDYTKMSGVLSTTGGITVKTDTDCIKLVGKDKAVAGDIPNTRTDVKVDDPILLVEFKATPDTAACKGVQSAVQKIKDSSPIRVGGSGVKFN